MLERRRVTKIAAIIEFIGMIRDTLECGHDNNSFKQKWAVHRGLTL